MEWYRDWPIVALLVIIAGWLASSRWWPRQDEVESESRMATGAGNEYAEEKVVVDEHTPVTDEKKGATGGGSNEVAAALMALAQRLEPLEKIASAAAAIQKLLEEAQQERRECAETATSAELAKYLAGDGQQRS